MTLCNSASLTLPLVLFVASCYDKHTPVHAISLFHAFYTPYLYTLRKRKGVLVRGGWRRQLAMEKEEEKEEEERQGLLVGRLGWCNE